MRRREQDLTPAGDAFRSLPGWSISTPDARLDRPERKVEQVLVIATIQRSGSNLLAEDLRLTEQMGVPRQYLISRLTFNGPQGRWPIQGARFRLPRSRLLVRTMERLGPPSTLRDTRLIRSCYDSIVWREFRGRLSAQVGAG